VKKSDSSPLNNNPLFETVTEKNEYVTVSAYSRTTHPHKEPDLKTNGINGCFGI